MMKMLTHTIKRFALDERANVTVEFVILFPSVITVFLTAFEAGFYMMRQVSLDSSINKTVRALRLGSISPLTHSAVKNHICESATLLPDCNNALLLELRPINASTWQQPTERVACVDRSADIQPVTHFVGGESNEMVLMRACVIVDPLFPTTGLGLALPKETSGGYALTSATAFVNEP